MAKPSGPRGTVKVAGKWYARWTCTEGHEHRKLALPANTAKEARDLAGVKRTQVRQARYLVRPCCPNDDHVATLRTVADLVDDFLEATKLLKRSHSHDVQRARRIKATFGTQAADSVTIKAVESFKLALAAEFSEPTANGYLKLLKVAYNRARRHEWVTRNPAAAVGLYTEHNARSRCLSAEEETRLLAALPAWLRPLVIVALHTGMRKGELLGLRWSDVDWTTSTVRLPLDKAGSGRNVAINTVAREALLSIKRDRTILAAWVFPSPEGKRFVNLERYWRPALAVAQIRDFRFHDLRHTFASRLTMAGVDLYTVQRAGGWKSQVMVQRYAHLSPDHMRAAVERLAPMERATQQEIRDRNRDWKDAGAGEVPAKSLNFSGDPGGIRTRDLDLERVASLARLDDGVPGPTAWMEQRHDSRPTGTRQPADGERGAAAS